MNRNGANRVTSGIGGLDEILHGGFIPGNSYLIRGGPGSGKTTLGFHFLTEGVARNESSLLLSWGEREEQMRKNAQSLGFDLKGVTIVDLSPTADFFTKDQSYDVFSPAEVEREPLTKKIVEQIERLKPKRVFSDAMTQLRYLSKDVFQFRKEVLALLSYLTDRGATVLFSSEADGGISDEDLQFMCDGVIHLESAERGRLLSVSKFRGSDFRSGSHSYRLTDQGIKVFPRLMPEEFGKDYPEATIPSGLSELDRMLHGGIERGTVSVISGPTGVGKTTLGMQFMKEAAKRNERSVIYSFEELESTVLRRCREINLPVEEMIKAGSLSLLHVEPLRFMADEFAQLVRHEVEKNKARIVMLDSITGYRLCLKGHDLTADLHALCKYLKNMGVTVILINEMEAISGYFRATEVGISYLADNIVFIRYIERRMKDHNEVRKIIGALKKRVTGLERTLHELEITREGMKVSQPVKGIQGVLGDAPVWNETN